MRPPIIVRELTESERERLEAGLRSKDLYELRRCQIVLASARGEWAPRIAATLGCTDQTVRNVIREFEQAGLEACLTRGSSRPHTIHAKVDAVAAEQLRALLHQSPRTFGKPTSVWTLELAAEVSAAEGITAERVRGETIRQALLRLGVRWRRAKQWITSPDPAYVRKQRARDRLLRLAATHPTWVVGFQDEVWWSRLARPSLRTWIEEDDRLRLIEQTVAKDDPDPKALACYGLLLRADPTDAAATDQMWLRFVDGRPVSAVTIDYLAWCCRKLQAQGKEALLLIWDNAPWHVSQQVRAWIRSHNRQVKRQGRGVRIIAGYLPSKSPWLNAIEATWVHGKRRVVEADGLLTATELADRVCDAYGCPHEPHLVMPKKVA
jgi:transposase